jgi:hypothetical protein
MMLRTRSGDTLRRVPFRPCPNCKRDAPRVIDSATAIAAVIYYPCDACGHVWHVPKVNPDGPPTTVSQGAKQPKA